MTEQTAGEAPWAAQSASAETAPTRQPRQQRKPREAKPAVAAPEVAPPARKPRKAKEKAERAAPETIKVTMREYAEMRVGDDAKVFIKLHGILSALTKSARTKVLAELSKVFG